MKRTIIMVTTILALGLLSCAAAPAAPPQIAHIHPDYYGNHLRRGAPHIISGENFGENLEIYTWVLLSEDKVIEEAAALLGTDKEPRLPDRPPLEGRQDGGWSMRKSGHPHWDVIYRWSGPAGHMGVDVFEVDGQVAVANLATASAHMNSFAVWLKNADGFSKPYLINIAQPRWLCSRQIQQGERLRIYGQGMNILFRQTRVAFRKGDDVRILNTDDAAFFLDYGIRGNETRLREVQMPMDMEPGEYSVYVHNGWGGPYGWAEAGKLTVEERQNETGKIFDAVDFGAVGDGRANDTAALQAALQAARQAGGGIVYLAPGTYIVDESLLLPSGVTLRGSARDNTIIMGEGFDPNVGPPDGRRTWGSAAPRPSSVLLLQPYTALERLGVRGQTARGTAGQTIQAVMGDANTPPLPHGAVYGQLRLRDIHVRGDFGSATSYTPRLTAYRVEIRDSEFHGSFGLFAMTIRADYINNRVYGGSISGFGYYDSLIERNIIRDGATRFFFYPPVHNTYIRYNETYNFGTQGSGGHGTAEAFLPHGGTDKHVGRVTSATENTLTDARRAWAEDALSQGRIFHMAGTTMVLITAGRGFGQYRQVVANDETTLTVDRPWRVVPDESSEYVVGNFYVDCMWYGNYLDGQGHMRMDGDHINVVVEKHYANLAGAVDLVGSDRGNGPGLAWYNTFINCHMEGSEMRFLPYEAPQRKSEGPVYFGNAAIGNNIMRPQHRDLSARHTRPTAGIGFADPIPANHVGAGRTLYTIIAGNTIASSDVGILVRDWARKTFILNNDFQDVRRPILDAGSGSVQRGNRQSAFCEEEVGKIKSEALPDSKREDPLGKLELPPLDYGYPEARAPQPASVRQADMLRSLIPTYTYIPNDVESAEVQQKCADNLKKLYTMLQDYERRQGHLPRATFYAEGNPLTEEDSLLLLLGKEARPFLSCPAAGPDFKAMGWPGYIWNNELSGRKLADIRDRKDTWLLMDFSAPHAWLVGNKHAGHRGGVNVLFADGNVKWLPADEVGKRWPFK